MCPIHDSPISNNDTRCQKVLQLQVSKFGRFGNTEAYNRLCVDRKLKEEYQIVKKKGLTHALDMPTVFKGEWIKIILS